MQALIQLSQANRIGIIEDKEFQAVVEAFFKDPSAGMRKIDDVLQKVRPFPGATDNRGRPLGYVQRAIRRKIQGGAFGIGEAIRSGNFNEAKQLLAEAQATGALTQPQIDEFKNAMPTGDAGGNLTEENAVKGDVNLNTSGPAVTGGNVVNRVVNRGTGGAVHSTTTIVLTLDGKTIAEVTAPHL